MKHRPAALLVLLFGAVTLAGAQSRAALAGNGLIRAMNVFPQAR